MWAWGRLARERQGLAQNSSSFSEPDSAGARPRHSQGWVKKGCRGGLGSAHRDGPASQARSLTTMDSSLLPQRLGVALPGFTSPLERER